MERNFIHMLNLSINYKKKIKKFIFVGIFIFFLTNLIFFSLYSSINLPTQHLDGAFQTASALFRIENGEIIGKDFLPYLGLGPFLILFPFFKIAGGNLFASVFAAKFIT